MRKLLYITVNSKPEYLSSSKTVGRSFINKFIKQYPDFTVEELDLYKTHIPRLEYQYFQSRNCIINEDATNDLPQKEQEEVHTIVNLCNQFVSADIYVIAAPMWSLSFPAPLKEYIDCIVQSNRTITFPEKGSKPQGLLNDKPRTVIYIQSSGADIPFVVRPLLNKGLNYIEDITKSMGIKQFERLLVDGTGTTEEERLNAIKRAHDNIDNIINKIEINEVMHV
ncbi:MAG: FMN-dependent NADH-azoreductase [Clostridiales bacterium]|jgi:FMN-dependent NADH-azoreductase|nr:FMN-dependent NADH-azoreductase [Clostridiales bacterium]